MLTRLLIILLAMGASITTSAEPENNPLATALFAGGCFWCMQPPFDALPGVVKTMPGYTGGKTENPSYGQVSAGGTDHVEALQIAYDPAKSSYE